MNQSTTTATPVAPPRNGFGITALVLALVGLVFGLVPFTGFLALILGGLAVLFGLLGWARTRRGEATNRKMAAIGTVLGAVVAALGIWGMTIVFGAVDDLDKALDGQGGVANGDPGVTTPSAGETVNQVAFGQAFTYEDGTVIAIGPPAPYKPSSSAAMSPTADRAVAVEVTVTNGTAKPLDLIAVSLQATAGEREAGQVYDSTKGITGVPSQTLPPGKRQTFTVVFELPAGPTELRVQARPGWFGYQPVFFTGQV
ncbi:MAG: hypothetical protein ACRDRG_04780 [Pseudonocardiaceae bacterium]